MNLPNALTGTRIFLVPLLVGGLLTKFEGRVLLGVGKEGGGAAILALILGDVYLPGFLVVGRAALWVVVVLALVSAGDYFRNFGNARPRSGEIEPADEIGIVQQPNVGRKAG